MLLDEPRIKETSDVAMVGWPIEARERMTQALSGLSVAKEQRRIERRPYHIEGRLLVSGSEVAAVPLYTRDVHLWNAGFIMQTPLPTGTRAMIRLRKPSGRGITVECRVQRCREFESGWFDCSVEFVQPQVAFAEM
jgi:hypothetical protein